MKARKGFTLIELLVVIGILGIMAGTLVLAISPDAQLKASADARRRALLREVQNAILQYVIDNGELPGDKTFPTNVATRMEICQPSQTDASCINLETDLVPDYLAQIPVDDSATGTLLSGIAVYEEYSRPCVTGIYFSANATDTCDNIITAYSATSGSSGGSGGGMSGSGTPGDPYLVTTCQELEDIETTDLDANYRIENSIDCSGIANFDPIGDGGSSQDFTGELDGNDQTVSNLSIVYPAGNSIGLFSALNGATITDLTITSATASGMTSVGILAGTSEASTTVTNVHTNGDVKGVTSVGGIVGSDSSGTLSRVSSSADVVAFTGVGGVVGNMGLSSTLENCFSTGDVTATAPASTVAGGLIGRSTASTIRNCYATGTIYGDTTTFPADGVGGLIGLSNLSNLTNSYSTATVNGSNYLGGVLGRKTADTFTNVHWYDQVDDTSNCVGHDGGGAPVTCTSAAAESDFFSATHDVYDTDAPNWDFVNVWQAGASYPTLR